MSKPFRFKQFEVAQDQCAMKIGTDGVLLGAWANIDEADSILDIGTGTGVLSLMSAQRNPHAQIRAIDIDEAAVRQAQDNFDVSPWGSRMKARVADLANYEEALGFSHIISNPPFYDQSHEAKGKARTNARHTSSLSFETLLKRSAELLKVEGSFSCIIPFAYRDDFIALANNEGLHLKRSQNVKGRAHLEAKRSLLEFTPAHSHTVELPDLTIELDRHLYTPEYISLTKEFYLKM